jgi:hypothetical protein
MATSFPAAIDSFGYTASAGAGVPFDVFQRGMDAIVAIETLLGAGSAAGTAFTPIIVSSGGGTPTYSVQVGRYRRVNGMVQLAGRITLATFGTLAAGTITIQGCPVTSVNIANLYGTCTVPYWAALTTATVNITGYVPPASASLTLHLVTAAVTTMGATQMTKADMTATSDFIFSAIYPAT